MSLIQITAQFQGPPLPAGVTLASVTLETTDSTGKQLPPISLNGTETPTPWSVQQTVAAGAGNINATMLDSTGAVIGSPVDVPYDTATAAGGLQLSGLSVATITP